jgi:methylthioribose-1-phosphate isomerase
MTGFKTIEWKHNAIKIIDQNKLPLKLEYVYLRTPRALWRAIKTLQVRGAPALAAAAALGVYLGIRDSRAGNFKEFSKEMDASVRYLGSARPTARNLFWALERMCSVAVRNRTSKIAGIKRLLFNEAQKIMEEDRRACRAIGSYGAKLIRKNDGILTICNAGIFATIDYGTALGVIYRAQEEGKHIRVYACETRPMLQGARLTMRELKQKGIDATLLCDSMAADLMRQGKIDKVIAGADRIAANGDTANKIGTYALAVLAKYHKIPFYIAAPCSTFDPSMASGRDIPIEEREAKEVTHLFFRKPIAPPGVKVCNPAFDVTPNNLITAIITDAGIIKPPYSKNLGTVLKP